MSDESTPSSEISQLIEIQKETLDVLKNQNTKKKDIWDRFSVLSTFLSTVLIAALGLYFTHAYNERQSARELQTKIYQTQILEMQTVEKFIPHLTGKDEGTKKVALLTLNALGSPELATRLAKSYPSEGTQEAADFIMATAQSSGQTQMSAAVSATASIGKRNGWAYLGHYQWSKKEWKTRYFDFAVDAVPESLQNENLLVGEKTGALNVRSGMPRVDGQFPKVIAVLKPGSKATVQEIQEWQSTGYIWARITYGT